VNQVPATGVPHRRHARKTCAAADNSERRPGL